MPVEIRMPFHPLLVSMTECLGYVQPLYLYTDVSNNRVSVCIRTLSKPVSYVYDGGEAATLEESCEKAAREAILDLKMRTDMYILDLTSRELDVIDRSTSLYKLKRVELERIEKGLSKVEFMEKEDGQSDGFSRVIQVDYVSILSVVLQCCDICSTTFEVLELGIGGFMAWFTLPPTAGGRLPKNLFGDYRHSRALAKQSLAVKVIEYLRPLYNFQVVDANYNPAEMKSHILACNVARDNYLAAKERILGVKKEVLNSPPMPDQECLTPTGSANQIPESKTLPHLVKKRGYNYFQGNSSTPSPQQCYVRRKSASKRGSAAAAVAGWPAKVPSFFSPSATLGVDIKPLAQA